MIPQQVPLRYSQGISWGKKGQHILQDAMPIKIDNYVFVKSTY
jgi:hypothetical protein